MSDVFISFARADSNVAQRIFDALQNEGISVFMDANSLVAGEDYSVQVSQEIEAAEVVVVLLSSRSTRGGWVEDELQASLRTGLRSGKTIIPILLDEHATENLVWPLVSDRQAIFAALPQGLDELVRKTVEAVRSAIRD